MVLGGFDSHQFTTRTIWHNERKIMIEVTLTTSNRTEGGSKTVTQQLDQTMEQFIASSTKPRRVNECPAWKVIKRNKNSALLHGGEAKGTAGAKSTETYINRGCGVRVDTITIKVIK